MDKEAILNDCFKTLSDGIQLSGSKKEILSVKTAILSAMDEFAASLKYELEGTKEIAMARGKAVTELQKEVETFKDAMIERNDRCNELTNELEYWKQRCEAKDREIERLKGLIEDAYITGRNYFKLFNGGTTWKQFKSENNL